MQLHARARNSCLIQNEFKGDASSFETQFEAVADKLLGDTSNIDVDFGLQLRHFFSFSGRIVEQQRRHAEAKRELLASRSFKSTIWGALPAVLGSPQVHPASVEHARLVIQLCLPTAR